MTDNELQLKINELESNIEETKQSIHKECFQVAYEDVDGYKLVMLSDALARNVKELLNVAKNIEREHNGG